MKLVKAELDKQDKLGKLEKNLPFCLPNAEVIRTHGERSTSDAASDAKSDESMSVRFEDGVLCTSMRKNSLLENNLFNALNLENLME